MTGDSYKYLERLFRGKTCFDVRYVFTKEFMSYFKIADGKKDYLRRYTLEGCALRLSGSYLYKYIENIV